MYQTQVKYIDPMKTSLFSFALVLFILNSIAPISSSRTFFNFTTDQHALLAFKNTLTSDPNGILVNNWSTGGSFFNWVGVSCSIKHQRVTALNVSGFQLGGTLAPHLGNLTFLRSLDISFNNFTGQIPSELSNLRHLKKINIGVNSFTGEIPLWFGAFYQLQHVYLNNNSFTGRIPSSLFNISRLQTLDMGYNFLSGNLPEEIGNFTYLEAIKLGGNQFTGKLPNDICSNTPNLKRIYLSANEFYGEIPTNIYKCRKLEVLVLPLNHLNGNIPSEIGGLTMLRILALYSNDLKGRIPKQLGNLTSLEELSLNNNYLTGELPQELANLAFLEGFSVTNNSLSSTIPSSIFNISTLKFLDLAMNEFWGSLPSNMGLSLFNLEELYLHTNRLSGPIPSSITNASNLAHVDMTSNSFSGSMPNFGNLRLLQHLRICGNNLVGAKFSTEELGFLTSLTNCPYLKVLQIGNNPLNGILPTSIGNLSASLLQFSAHQSNINGVIPSEIGNLSSLLSIFLDGNQMRGVIPTTIGKLKRLERFYLYDNQLKGYITSEVCQMSNLGQLYLNGNMFTGPIPECLGELKSLRYINFGLNNLNSTIPSNLWNLRDLLELNLSSNYLSGQLSPQIANLKVINSIDLSSNQFSRDIPGSIDGCQSLETLSLSNNMFRGSIPQSLGNVRGLMTLDLSKNNLSGLIPESLEDLLFLQYFNVSHNKLEGKIPNGGCFANFTAQSFVDNSALCGPTRFQVPPCLGNHGQLTVKSVAQLMKLMKYIVPSVFFSFISTIILVKWRGKRKKIPSPTDFSLREWGLREWGIFSCTELLRGTSCFSETKVFKATLANGLNVAVKVFNTCSEGAMKSFDTESEILSSIRHKNVVRLIGCCKNSEFRALILTYMPNGSLDNWLHSKNSCLDLLQRLKIAIDIALALEHLHHGHIFPVVHRDINPSNVLLDQYMNAHICGFGISKFLDSNVAVETSTLGTIGYTAPGDGWDGKVSTQGDVYSYGIMLLEIFTAKRPTDDMFSAEMSLKEWVDRALQENAVSEVVAPALLSREDPHFNEKMQCVSYIFDLAMKCSAFSPGERINMRQTVAILHRIKVDLLASNRMSQR